MTTRKQLRVLVRKLSESDEALRQEVLHLIRNAQSKEQAAYQIVTKLQERLLETLSDEVRKISQDSDATIEKINRTWEADFHKMEQHTRSMVEEINETWKTEFQKLEEDQSGEAWKGR